MSLSLFEQQPSSEVAARLLQWYDQNHRTLPWRENRDPYRIWISEIMLQQTRVEAVKEYFRRFLERFPDLAALAKADEATVFKFWQGLGYYSRARNLHRAAQIMVEQHGGHFPKSLEEIQALPGIGEYTSGAISSIAFDAPAVAIDGNVLRVWSRLCGRTLDRKQATPLLSRVIPETRRGDMTQAWMELGATVCLPNGMPLCEHCPFGDECEARISGRIAELPEKAPVKARKKVQLSVFLLTDASLQNVLLHQRNATGLLAKLWEFPNTPARFASAAEAEKFLNSQQIFLQQPLRQLPESKHIFTHIEWQMQNYQGIVSLFPAPSDLGEWKSRMELESSCAIPNAFQLLMKEWNQK